METKNFAKIIETKERDFVVSKHKSDAATGVLISSVYEGRTRQKLLFTTTEAEINPLFDNITSENVKIEFEGETAPPVVIPDSEEE